MTFGGGFAIISFLRKTFADKLKWLEEKEILDLMAVAQCSTGAVAVNASFLIGHKLARVKGALTTTMSTIIPPLIINSILPYCYEQIIHFPLVQVIMSGRQESLFPL